MVTNAKKYARLRDEQFSLFENYARKHGMNGKSLLIFLWIYHNPNGITQEWIAKRTFSSKQVVQAIVKNYVSKGWLYLEPSQTDKRKKLVRLSKEGQERVDRLIKPLDRIEEKTMESLSLEQQELLLVTTEAFSRKFRSLLEGAVVND
ncbi:helix-turn-helix domain-containing protein [Streptococcus orisratti]|uniref:MarR family transcriptional regulator n=1 Tax=Streptococcus orisratti TaxID=114652 RepID=UPI00294384C2|nr:helix-turn-helix domain-containing protein [Streptococcus orisratti]